MLLSKKFLLVLSTIVACMLSGCGEKQKLEDGSELINKNQFVLLLLVNLSHLVI